MDYGKSGSSKGNAKEPRHIDQTAKGKQKAPGGRLSKEELLERMKATAEAKKK